MYVAHYVQSSCRYRLGYNRAHIKDVARGCLTCVVTGKVKVMASIILEPIILKTAEDTCSVMTSCEPDSSVIRDL